MAASDRPTDHVQVALEMKRKQKETIDLGRKVQELEVACAELKALPEGREVYQKKSTLFFYGDSRQTANHLASEADELIGEASISTSAAASEADEKVVSEELRSSGAVVFKRSSAQSHFEFATTLEKLDLAKLSSELSRESANRMGLQVEGDGAQAETPVEVLIDVEKDGRNLRLEGIANTAITVKCNTCGEAVAERVFAEFELLLTDAPVLEPVQKSVGVVLGKNVYPSEGPDEEDAGLDLDLDDKMYFPKDVKRLDISEYISLETRQSQHGGGSCSQASSSLKKFNGDNKHFKE
eukprot:jgi/Mesen1/5447/ME000272S04783